MNFHLYSTLTYSVLILLLLFTCRESTESMQNDDIFAIDLQDGFKTDSVKVSLDHETIFSDTITSNPHTGLAKRIPLNIPKGSHRIAISMNNGNISFETTREFLDILVYGFLFDRFAGNIWISGYTYFPEYPYVELNDFVLTNIEFKSGEISADLTPPIPKDPINAKIVLYLENTSEFKIVPNLSFPQADVILDSTDQNIGTIEFTNIWDGYLLPMELDSLELYKIQSDSTLLEPPCNKFAYFNIKIIDRYDNVKMLTTDSVLFECTY